jgi:ATPase family associated with various cellular activities (AAA)
MLDITVIRCDPPDLQAALLRLEIPEITWSISQQTHGNKLGIDQLQAPIKLVQQHAGVHVWRNYLTGLSCLDSISQQMVCDLFHDLYFARWESPCQVFLIQTDSTPIPASISFFITEKFVALPTTPEIQTLLNQVNLSPDERMLRLATGLSHADLQRCFSNLDREVGASAHDDCDIHAQIEKFRSQRLGLKGIRYEAPPKYIEIGGLDLLSEWIDDLDFRLSAEAEALDLPYPRGVLFAGVPGTGKTFAARAISSRLGYPMFSISMDAVQDGGAIKFLELLATIESLAPCILFADEIEKLFGGNIDGKVKATFLTWLNDKTAKVFVIGTLNRMAEMPIEMTRAGRFDRTFFVDTPDEGQRVELCRLFLKRFDDRFKDAEDPVFELEGWQSFADATIEFIGAEIQQLVNDTVAKVKRRDPQAIVDIDDLITVALKFKSMYKRDAKKILEIRNTLKDKADPASSGSRKFLPTRKLDIYAPIERKK